MKLSNRHLEPQKLELAMTSMIDVVFLLLIFFLVTTTFIQPEKEVAANIQVAETEAARDTELSEPAMIDVVMADKNVVYRIGAIRTNDVDEIRKVLAAFDDKRQGAFVRVAGDVPYEAVAQVMGVCKAANFPSVSYMELGQN